MSANPFFNITLIDQDEPASGATGAALGVLMAIISQKTKGRSWKLRQTSIKRYHTLISELEQLTSIKIPHNSQGILKLFPEEKDTQKWLKLSEKRAKEGYILEVWNQEQISCKCPHLCLDGVKGAIYSPQDLQVNPVILTKALVAGAVLRGVNCIFGQKVHNFEIEKVDQSNKVHCFNIQTSDATIKSDWIILAAGLGSTNLIKSLKKSTEWANLTSSKTLSEQELIINPVLGQALLLKSPQIIGNLDFQPVITNNDVHLLPMGKGEYWVGATVEFPDQNGYSLPKDEELLAKVHQDAIAFCPQLAQASVMLSWSGKRPRPEGQSAPVIKKLEGCKNIILATGHYRNGVLLAPATAKVVGELIKEI